MPVSLSERCAMNLEFRQHKQAIRSFMQLHYSDERLAQLLAHAQSGRLKYSSCCCFVGVATADHTLRTAPFFFGFRHLNRAWKLVGGRKADHSYFLLDYKRRWWHPPSDDKRRRILIPMIRAEIRRRDQFKTSVGEYCDVHQEAVR